LRRMPADWTPAPAAAAPRIESQLIVPTVVVPAVEFDWATETARHVGTVVHRELQRIGRDAVRPDAADESLRRRWLDELAELGVPQDRRAAAVERVASAVTRTLQHERGRWLLYDEHHEAATELAVTGRVGGDIVRVVIDRTFVTADGVRWIVDYKTSSHEGAGLEAFLDREQERYRLQLERYALLLRKLAPGPVRLGLYFPLLAAWREWSAP
jgi:ATP-dependent helicase/nuclease subunit A